MQQCHENCRYFLPLMADTDTSFKVCYRLDIIDELIIIIVWARIISFGSFDLELSRFSKFLCDCILFRNFEPYSDTNIQIEDLNFVKMLLKFAVAITPCLEYLFDSCQGQFLAKIERLSKSFRHLIDIVIENNINTNQNSC